MASNNDPLASFNCSLEQMAFQDSFISDYASSAGVLPNGTAVVMFNQWAMSQIFAQGRASKSGEGQPLCC